jgi:LuxR family maltose regulon positive regulatory protein
MPRRAPYLLRWCPETGTYVLRCGAEGEPLEITPDGPAWLDWLDGVASFSFQSRSGDVCTVRKETVQRGGAYWYAYRRAGGRMAKRYLGRTADVSLARLEEVAAALASLAADDLANGAGDEPRAATEPLASDRTGSVVPAAEPHPGSRRVVTANVASPSSVVLSTKLHVPRASSRLLSRPRVFQRLDRGLERPLTVLAAPAGFGKTTALCAWLPRVPGPAAWVSLDAGDNDPIQFWTYVLTALESAHPGVATTPLAMLQLPHPPPLATVLRTLINAIAALADDVVLVLDDYHLITAPAIHESIALLLAHPPPQLHLYLASRSEPPLPLARLRAYDQVSEIRADDLRFQPDEVGAWLGEVMGLRLSAEDVARLAERTDGWAAGLQLAALSLQGHPDPSRFIASFGGSHRYVLTYLGDEVLAAQPPEIQSFLVRTAILERLCGPLCDALTGQRDGQAMLVRLEQANLFLIRLDDDGRWYRYDHLFRDLLRHRLREERSVEIPDLHRRAADWLKGEGLIAEAVEHLLAIPDAEEAACLIEQSTREMLVRNEYAAVLSLIGRLPEEAIAARPRLCLYHAGALLSSGRLDDAERWISYAERWFASASEQKDPATADPDRRDLAGEVASLKAALAAMRGDAATAIHYARTALEALPEQDAFSRASVVLTLGLAYDVNGDPQAADEALIEASRLSFAAENLPMATLALRLRAYLLMSQGRLQQAADLLHQVIQVSEARGGALAALAGGAYSGLATILYERNDLVGARLAAEKAIALGEQWANPEDEIDGLVRRMLVHQAEGQSRAALEAAQRIEQIVRSNATFPWTRALAAAAGALLALRQGRLADAERWADEHELSAADDAPDSTSLSQTFERIVYARVLIARQRLAEVAELLGRLQPQAETEARIGNLVGILALQALVWQARGESATALETLERAVSLALPEGYVRVFVDEGAPMRSLLARLRERQHKGSVPRRYVDTLLAAFESTAAPPRDAARPRLIDPPSAREREVLRLLARGRSNQEIARELVVAVSTVKTHVHNLYAKLQAADRLEAVMRARELGLLDQ